MSTTEEVAFYARFASDPGRLPKALAQALAGRCEQDPLFHPVAVTIMADPRTDPATAGLLYRATESTTPPTGGKGRSAARFRTVAWMTRPENITGTLADDCDRDPALEIAVAESPSTPPAILARITEHINDPVRQQAAVRAACHPYCPPDAAVQALKTVDEKLYVESERAGMPGRPHHVERLQREFQLLLRLAAAPAVRGQVPRLVTELRCPVVLPAFSGRGLPAETRITIIERWLKDAVAPATATKNSRRTAALVTTDILADFPEHGSREGLATAEPTTPPLAEREQILQALAAAWGESSHHMEYYDRKVLAGYLPQYPGQSGARLFDLRPAQIDELYRASGIDPDDPEPWRIVVSLADDFHGTATQLFRTVKAICAQSS